jgi:hypothetical protein
MKITIVRITENDRQTIGMGFVHDESGRIHYGFNSLELPFLNNKLKISCIPAGKYTIVKRVSKRFGNHFLVKDVKNRSYILIHHGNYYYQTEGCILVGKGLQDINVDNLLDVLDSKTTMSKLLALLGVSSELTIINNF